MKYLKGVEVNMQCERGILNEIQIIERMVHEEDDKKIVITPLIDAKTQINPSSVDLRLGNEFKISETTRYTHLEPCNDKEEVAREILSYTKDVHLDPFTPFILHPFEFVLGSTLEFIKVPKDLAARLEGRSSWGRLGLQIHSTAGFVDPGYSGSLTFEFVNVGKIPLKIFPGVRIGQISFYTTQETSIPYQEKVSTKYSGSVAAISSVFYKDYEFGIIRKDHRYCNKNDKDDINATLSNQ